MQVPESLRESLTSALLLAGMVAVQMYLLRWFAFLLLPLLYVYARVFLTRRRRVETVGGPAPSLSASRRSLAAQRHLYLPAGARWPLMATVAVGGSRHLLPPRRYRPTGRALERLELAASHVPLLQVPLPTPRPFRCLCASLWVLMPLPSCRCCSSSRRRSTAPSRCVYPSISLRCFCPSL